MQCNAMQMQCNVRQWNAMQCNAMQCNAMQCNEMQWNAMKCNAMQCSALKNYSHCYAQWTHSRRPAAKEYRWKDLIWMPQTLPMYKAHAMIWSDDWIPDEEKESNNQKSLPVRMPLLVDPGTKKWMGYNALVDSQSIEMSRSVEERRKQKRI